MSAFVPPKSLRLYLIYRFDRIGTNGLVGITNNVGKWLEHINDLNKDRGEPDNLDVFEIKPVGADIFTNLPDWESVHDEGDTEGFKQLLEQKCDSAKKYRSALLERSKT